MSQAIYYINFKSSEKNISYLKACLFFGDILK